LAAVGERGVDVKVSIHLSDEAKLADREAILGPLVAFNVQQTGIVDDYRPLVLTVHDEGGRVIGGLWGRTSTGWLFVELLFVPEPLRGHDIGSELMSRAESEATARGCHSAWLDTFEFQARGFYERLGYCCFGELRDYPPGFSRYFMKKALSAGAARG
jgi:GNAT superfamily N-acetyltransferase